MCGRGSVLSALFALPGLPHPTIHATLQHVRGLACHVQVSQKALKSSRQKFVPICPPAQFEDSCIHSSSFNEYAGLEAFLFLFCAFRVLSALFALPGLPHPANPNHI
jgi:hypothetical protein